MSTPQDHTRTRLREWASTATAHARSTQPAATHLPSVDSGLAERQARHAHVLAAPRDQRLHVAGDTIDEALDWNSGRGHLIVTGPGLPGPALNSLTLLGFDPAAIEAALSERIDEDGNLTTEDIVAATAVLTDAVGTEDGFLEAIHARATSPEALHQGEHHAYHDESVRVDALPLADLIAETGHPDLNTAREALAEARGFVSYDHLDQVIEDVEWSEATTHLYRSLTPTERALLEAREPAPAAEADHDDLSTAFPEFDQASSQAASYVADHSGDVDGL